MKKLKTIGRKILKAPLLLLIAAMSRVQHFKMYEKWWVPQKLEHLFGLYEKETTRFFKKNIKKGMVVAEIGANVGYYSKLFSKLVGKEGRVYAFEPDYEAFEFLKYNTERLANVEIFPCAVTDKEGEVQFYHVIRGTSNHTLLPIDNAEVKTVQTVSLDNFIPGKIDALIVDVEGAEDQVFRGMKRHFENLTWVVFEYTIGEGEPLIEELKKTGDIYALSPAGELRPLPEIAYYTGGRGGNLYSNVVYQKRT